MPRAGELEALPDGRALEMVLGRLLLVGGEGGGAAAAGEDVLHKAGEK